MIEDFLIYRAIWPQDVTRATRSSFQEPKNNGNCKVSLRPLGKNPPKSTKILVNFNKWGYTSPLAM